MTPALAFIIASIAGTAITSIVIPVLVAALTAAVALVLTRASEAANRRRDQYAAAPRSRRVTSVCSGAFVLAAAGLLDGRRATTHWGWTDQLARGTERYNKLDYRKRDDEAEMRKHVDPAWKRVLPRSSQITCEPSDEGKEAWSWHVDETYVNVKGKWYSLSSHRSGWPSGRT